MKKIFTLVSLCLLLFNTTAQTKIIAHKSHSGTSEAFSASDDDNFGLSPEFQSRLDTVIKLTNNRVIEIFHIPAYENSERIVDTMTNHPVFNNPEVSLDSMKKRYPNVEFIGFDQPVKTQKKSKKHRARASLSNMSFSNENTNGGSGTMMLTGISLLLFMIIALLLWRSQTGATNKRISCKS
jgi:hypothetical protein